MRSVRVPDRSEITEDTPLRLEAAAVLAFPGGGMTASGLRKERDAKRLVTEIVAGKEYTTLRDIERMREACRGRSKVRVSTPKPSDATPTEPSSPAPSGSSETAPFAAAQAFLLRTLDKPLPKPSKPSANTSPKSMRRRGTATVLSLPSR
jgi:hypothetical protein